jgi:hypothetical protein
MNHHQLSRQRRPTGVAARARHAILEELAGTLTVHMTIENCRFRVADQKALARGSRVQNPHERAIASGGLDRNDIRAKLSVLRELIEESVGEEDAELLLDAARIMIEESLASLGAEVFASEGDRPDGERAAIHAQLAESGIVFNSTGTSS